MKGVLSFLCVFGSFLSVLFSVNADCGPWIPIDIRSLAPAAPGDLVDVKYLVAPLLECSYNDDGILFVNIHSKTDFSSIGAYHGGLSFTNRNSGLQFTVDFEGFPSFEEAVVPIIVESPNGTVNLQWQNFGKVFIYPGENDTFWETIEPIAVLNGVAYNQFMKWLSTTNQTYPYYNFWSVWTGWPGQNLLSGFECFGFVWDCFGKLKELNATFLPNIHPKQSFVTLYSNSVPTKVDVTDSDNMAQIAEFYETLEGKIADEGFIGFLLELYEIIDEGLFFVRKDNDYYRVQLDHFPYFDIHYVEIPLP